MGKKKVTKEFREVAQVAMGAGMVGSLTPLLSNPSAGNIGNSMQGMFGFAMLAPLSKVGFDAIDKIGVKGKKK